MIASLNNDSVSYARRLTYRQRLCFAEVRSATARAVCRRSITSVFGHRRLRSLSSPTTVIRRAGSSATLRRGHLRPFGRLFAASLRILITLRKSWLSCFRSSGFAFSLAPDTRPNVFHASVPLVILLYSERKRAKQVVFALSVRDLRRHSNQRSGRRHSVADNSRHRRACRVGRLSAPGANAEHSRRAKENARPGWARNTIASARFTRCKQSFSSVPTGRKRDKNITVNIVLSCHVPVKNHLQHSNNR